MERGQVQSHLERDTDGTLTVRPLRGGAARGRAIAYAAPAGAFAVLMILRQATQSSRDALITVVIAIPLLALGVLYMMRYLRTNRIYLTPAVIGHTGDILGRPREVPRGSIASMVQVTTGYAFSSTSPIRYLLVVGRDGRCLMRINWMYYSTGDLQALATELGVDYQIVPSITPRTLCQEIPGAVPWIVLHPLLFATAGVVVILAAVIAGIAVFGGSGSG